MSHEKTAEIWSRQISFTTLPPVLLQEQPIVVLSLEWALVAQVLAMGRARWTRWFMWFRPLEHNTLHPWREYYCIASCVFQASAALG
jgi:hypothetical protein